MGKDHRQLDEFIQAQHKVDPPVSYTHLDVYKRQALVFGQMNEPPGARMRVAMTGLTLAEYFRDTAKQDVLLFIDNIFRYIQAGSEVSALDVYKRQMRTMAS